MKLYRRVRSQNRGSWVCQRQLDYCQVPDTCISHVFHMSRPNFNWIATQSHVKYSIMLMLHFYGDTLYLFHELIILLFCTLPLCNIKGWIKINQIVKGWCWWVYTAAKWSVGKVRKKLIRQLYTIVFGLWISSIVEILHFTILLFRLSIVAVVSILY